MKTSSLKVAAAEAQAAIDRFEGGAERIVAAHRRGGAPAVRSELSAMVDELNRDVAGAGSSSPADPALSIDRAEGA